MTSRTSDPRGMTLMEVLLVLALLVTVAALSFPALEGPMDDYRLVKSADLVRAAWGKARVEAMETGRVQMFRYEPGGRLYQIEPWYADSDYDELDLETMQQDQWQMAGQSSQVAAQTVQQEELPEGVTFYGGETMASARDAAVGQSLVDAGLSTQQWSEPILFHPDGAATTAQVILNNERNGFVIVKLRGLTGLARVSDLLTSEELPQ